MTGTLIFSACCLFFMFKRMLRYLRYYQQDDYRSSRFARWLIDNRAVDKRGTLILLAAAILLAILPSAAGPFITIVLAGGLVAIAAAEENPLRSGKIPLKLTDRARRILVLGFIIASTFMIGVIALRLRFFSSEQSLWIFTCVTIQGIPAYLMLANRLLLPSEMRRQRFFRQDTERRLTEVAPFTIGITGSYGKTSTKAIVAEMLEALGSTLAPSGSVNTPMGIARFVRENLRPYHSYAVFEMGAYGQGSIQGLSDFLHPNAAIITTIGIMHLERFGSEEAVFMAKAELASAIPDGGILVLNGDDANCRRLAGLHARKRILFFGLDKENAALLDCSITDISFAATGTSFVLHWRGISYPAQTPLLGRPALYNILAAFTMVAALGADVDFLLAKIRSLRPQPNRLELTKAPSGVIVLRDAYNSNPVGFRAALEVLAALPATRRILVTPGMVELGPRQEEDNMAVAGVAGQVCDLVFVVGTPNREAFRVGLRKAGRSVDVSYFAERNAALVELEKVALPGDVVLIANDLPDLYEKPVF